jgi:hypothetical protein
MALLYGNSFTFLSVMGRSEKNGQKLTFPLKFLLDFSGKIVTSCRTLSLNYILIIDREDLLVARTVIDKHTAYTKNYGII